MTRFLSDVEIYTRKFTNESVWGRLAIYNQDKLFIMYIQPNLNDLALLYAIIHELEHYNITKAVWKMGFIPSEMRVNGETYVTSVGIPEWTHSKPSYYPYSEHPQNQVSAK